jgi:hypothetical protein
MSVPECHSSPDELTAAVFANHVAHLPITAANVFRYEPISASCPCWLRLRDRDVRHRPARRLLLDERACCTRSTTVGQ